jgi:hypothetical protein
MFRSKLFIVFAVFSFIFVITMFDCVLAGEKIKVHGTSFTTDWQQTKVGDEEGHILGIQQSTQVYINEITGEKYVSTGTNSFDINPKKGYFTMNGYGITTDPEGDQLIRKTKGKPVGKGHWKGTTTYIKGTGKYEGVKGSGTWESWSLTPKISYIEAESEWDIPKN